MAALIVLVAVAFRQALETYFLADDFLLINFANSFRPATMFHMLTTGGGDGFFRPAGYFSLGLTATWAKFDPRVWHATALALHALNAVLVSVLAARLGLSRRASWFAGALFAIHGCLPESTVWIAGRFDLLATCFVLSGLLAFAAEWRVLSVAFLVLALLSKEEAYVFPLLALLLAISLRIPWRKAAPLLSLFLLLTCILFAYRWNLQGGIGGYTDLRRGASIWRAGSAPGDSQPRLAPLGGAVFPHQLEPATGHFPRFGDRRLCGRSGLAGGESHRPARLAFPSGNGSNRRVAAPPSIADRAGSSEIPPVVPSAGGILAAARQRTAVELS